MENVVDGMCGRMDNVRLQDDTAASGPSVSPILTSLPEVIADLIRNFLSLEDLSNILRAFPEVTELPFVTTKAVVTARMSQDDHCPALKDYAYNLQNLYGNHFPSTRRWCKIFEEKENECELCGRTSNNNSNDHYNQVQFDPSCNLFRCSRSCPDVFNLFGLFGTKNKLISLEWSEEQDRKRLKFQMVALPRFAVESAIVRNGEACGPLCTKREIDRLSLQELSQRYPSIQEQFRRLNIMTHYLELRGCMDTWTPVTAILVTTYKILESFVKKEQEGDTSDGNEEAEEEGEEEGEE